MELLLQQIALCIERGKINSSSSYPPDMKGQDGADELAQKALDRGITPRQLLNEGLMIGMNRVGEKFRDKLIYVPDVLMSARAMNAAMEHLKPFFQSNQLSHYGTFILGTVRGDLHDIGKKIVGMVVEGAGWKVIDLGTDVSPEKFINHVEENPNSVVGLSALLTTTMINMESTVKKLKETLNNTTIIIGGAPVTAEFAKRIGADGYSPDPQGAVEFLNEWVKQANVKPGGSYGE